MWLFKRPHPCIFVITSQREMAIAEAGSYKMNIRAIIHNINNK
jgi:hypothetical protein